MNYTLLNKPPTLILIPARAGSKSIPGKNILLFAGKPLIGWSIECALASGEGEAVVLSTDDPGIAEIGREYGAQVPHLRPPELSQDDTPTAPVAKHVLIQTEAATKHKFEYVIILEPTSPARKTEHISEALDLLQKTGADSVSGISEVPHHYVSKKILTKAGDGSITGIAGDSVADMVHRRQDLEIEYAFNGIIWACHADLLRSETPSIWGSQNIGFVIDSKFSIDLDSQLDWEIGEVRMQMLEEELSYGSHHITED